MYSDRDDLTAGFPHSDIHGSKPARGSPWLFAACHVLHRLLAPRHPPNALLTLEFSRPRSWRTEQRPPRGSRHSIPGTRFKGTQRRHLTVRTALFPAQCPGHDSRITGEGPSGQRAKRVRRRSIQSPPCGRIIRSLDLVHLFTCPRTTLNRGSVARRPAREHSPPCRLATQPQASPALSYAYGSHRPGSARPGNPAPRSAGRSSRQTAAADSGAG